MKLVTYAHRNTPDQTQIGIWQGNLVYPMDTGQATGQTMLDFIASGAAPHIAAGAEGMPIDTVTLRAPLLPRKLLGIGRNYADHAAELGNDVPAEPLLFAMFSTSVIGPGDTITWSESITQQVDWEGELVVIIGKEARNVPVESAMAHVFGYTVGDDVSARDLQDNDGQWARAKGMDTFCPLGPCIVTRDDIADPHNLQLTTTVNGETVQQASTSLMMHRIPQIVAHCSRAFTLQPGDAIFTGTPAGVGKGFKPPRFLKTGDTVRVTIDGIGTLENPCQVV